MRWARNSGQGCGATTRTLVPQASYDEAPCDGLRTHVTNLHIGSPWLGETDPSAR